MLRTIEDVLGLEHLGVHDGGLPPMSDSFDLEQSSWTFKAFPALVLFNTQLPLLDKNAFEGESSRRSQADARCGLVGCENQHFQL